MTNITKQLEKLAAAPAGTVRRIARTWVRFVPKSYGAARFVIDGQEFDTDSAAARLAGDAPVNNKITWQQTIDTGTTSVHNGWLDGRCVFTATLLGPGSSRNSPVALTRYDDNGFSTFVGAFETVASAKAAAKRASLKAT